MLAGSLSERLRDSVRWPKRCRFDPERQSVGSRDNLVDAGHHAWHKVHDAEEHGMKKLIGICLANPTDFTSSSTAMKSF